MAKTPKEKEAVLNVYASMVRPLMQVAFEYGISASEIAGVVRRTYIQALESKLQEQNRPSTDARLAVVAGMTNSEVTALREAMRLGAPHSLRGGLTLDQLTNVLTVWHTQTGFSGAYGIAMELDLAPKPGSLRKNFIELVSIACPGMDPDAVLDELIASGCVEIIEGATVRCLSRAYVPPGADVARIERMGKFLSLVSSNFAHNLLREEGDPGFFERAVVSDEKLSKVGQQSFDAITRERGQELLSELDDFLTRMSGEELNTSGQRFGVGIYFFEETSNDKFDAEDLRQLRSEKARKKSVNTVEEIDVLAPTRRPDPRFSRREKP